MSSAAFSVPSGSSDRLSLHRPLRTPSTATSAAADEAIAQVLRRQSGQLDRRDLGSASKKEPPVVARPAGKFIGGVSDSMERFGFGPWLFRVAVVVGLAVVLGAGVWAVFRSGPPRHPVGGLAIFERQPLANATLVFHLCDPSRPATHTIKTGPDGSFHSDEAGLPAGMYAVVVTPPAPPPGRTSALPPFPKAYRDPATTPLRVDLMEGMENLRVLVLKGR
jgi:hypothetical protein